MSIKLGNIDIDDIYFGTEIIRKGYIGNSLFYIKEDSTTGDEIDSAVLYGDTSVDIIDDK